MLFSPFLLKNGHFDDCWFRLCVHPSILKGCAQKRLLCLWIHFTAFWSASTSLSSSGVLEVSCFRFVFTVTASGSESSSLSSSGALEEECYASGFTDTASGSAYSSLSSSGALEEARVMPTYLRKTKTIL